MKKQIRKVALVTAPYHSGVVESAGTWLNVGFLYIAGALREAGYEVDYYDAMAKWDDWDAIRKRLEDFQPDVVAGSIFTAAAVAGIQLVRLAKEINPEVITVMGNVHATFSYTEMLTDDHRSIDFIIRGEGEEILPALLDCLNEDGDLEQVKGLAFYQYNNDGQVFPQGKIVTTPPADFIKDLDKLSPAWDLVEWPIYTYRAKKNSRLAIVSSSRGCTQNCSFCSQKLFWDQSWRARSAENFVAELEMLHSQYGVNIAMLADETPTLDRQRWETILDLMIERNVQVRLLMETRVVDIIRDEDIMWKYRKAGIEHIYVGVEAGDQARLNMFRKGTKVEQCRHAIKIINDHDIVSETSFVLGMPDDTKESIADIVELAKDYNADMAFFLAIAPWPYADIYPELEPHVQSKDYSRYNLVTPVVKPLNMELDELEQELAMASKRFFMHKFQNLEKLSPWKQEFMIAVFDILLNYSYLSKDMQEMGKMGGARMPEVVKKMLRKVAKSRKGFDKVKPIAPLV